MKKKLVAMLLAAGMVVSSLSGCGQREEQKGEESKSTSTAKVENSESEVKTSEAEKEVPKKIEKVKWIVRCDAQEDDAKVLAEVNKLLAERYSLELELVPISMGEYNDRMNLIITSGEEFDICYTANFTNNFYTNVEREAFLGLNDLLETEAADLLMSVYPEGLTDVTTVNGTIYGLPNYQLLYDLPGAYIQKDLAEKYELDVDSINDIQDLEPFMEKIRDNEKDIWPLDESTYTVVPRTLDYADFCGMTVGVANDDTSYTVKKLYETDGWYERYKVLNSYYHRGFIRSDVATVVDNSSDKNSNRYAIIIGTCKPGGDVEVSNKYGKEYIMVPFGEPSLAYNAGATTISAISASSKNPEAAIKLLGAVWSDVEIFNMLLYGLEGEHYKKVGENRVELIENSGYNRSSYGWMLGNQFNAWLLPGQSDDAWKVTMENNENAKKSVLTGFVFDSSAVATEVAQISSVRSELFNKFKYAEDYDAWVTELTTKLEGAGVDKCLAEVQKQVDAWKEANGK